MKHKKSLKDYFVKLLEELIMKSRKSFKNLCWEVSRGVNYET